MPDDELYLDTLLSAPGLLSSHTDWHGAQDPSLEPWPGSLFPGASQNTPLSRPRHQESCKGLAALLPARSKTQAVPGTREVLHRDPGEEEEVTDTSLSFTAMLFRHLQLRRHQESGSHRFPALAYSSFQPTALWTVTQPSSVVESSASPRHSPCPQPLKAG